MSTLSVPITVAVCPVAADHPEDWELERQQALPVPGYHCAYRRDATALLLGNVTHGFLTLRDMSWESRIATLIGVVALVQLGSCYSPVHHCCLGRELVIDVTMDSAPPLFYPERGTLGGYLPELLGLIADELGMTLKLQGKPHYERVASFVARNSSAFMDSTVGRMEVYGWSNRLYGEAMYQYGKMFPKLSVVTLHADTYGAMVLQTAQRGAGWRLFLPFSDSLWAAIIVAVLTFAALLMTLEIVPKLGTPAWQDFEALSFMDHVNNVATTVYHGFAAVLQGEDYEFDTWPARILRLGMLFFVLVTTSTYTANLAAFFTAPAVTLHGPQTMKELQTSHVHATSQFLEQHLSPFCKSLTFAYGPEGALGTVEEASFDGVLWAMDLLEAREAKVFVSSRSSLQYHQRARCASFAIVEHIKFGRSDQLLVFHEHDHELSHNVSIALDWLAAQPALYHLQDKFFNSGSPCAQAAGELDSVSLESQTGVFVIFGGSALLALCTSLVQTCCQARWQREDAPSDTNGDRQASNVSSNSRREGSGEEETAKALAELLAKMEGMREQIRDLHTRETQSKVRQERLTCEGAGLVPATATLATMTSGSV